MWQYCDNRKIFRSTVLGLHHTHLPTKIPLLPGSTGGGFLTGFPTKTTLLPGSMGWLLYWLSPPKLPYYTGPLGGGAGFPPLKPPGGLEVRGRYTFGRTKNLHLHTTGSHLTFFPPLPLKKKGRSKILVSSLLILTREEQTFFAPPPLPSFPKKP